MISLVHYRHGRKHARGLVHYRHGTKHGTMQADMVLEKEPRALHPDSGQHDAGPSLRIWNLKVHPPVTHLFQQSHTS